jgi:hypothetical protein
VGEIEGESVSELEFVFEFVFVFEGGLGGACSVRNRMAALERDCF